LPDHVTGSSEWNDVIQSHTQSHYSSGLRDGFMQSPFG
jgi:hypothetical protein